MVDHVKRKGALYLHHGSSNVMEMVPVTPKLGSVGARRVIMVKIVLTSGAQSIRVVFATSKEHVKQAIQSRLISMSAQM